MFTLIGFAVGAFGGYLASGYLDGMQQLRQTVRQAVDTGISTASNILSNATRSFGLGPFVNIGIGIVVLLLVLWLMGFGTALIIGVVVGLIYSDEIGRLPFVAGAAATIKEKIDSTRKS